jgi:hypothetical protein
MRFCVPHYWVIPPIMFYRKQCCSPRPESVAFPNEQRDTGWYNMILVPVSTCVYVWFTYRCFQYRQTLHTLRWQNDWSISNGKRSGRVRSCSNQSTAGSACTHSFRCVLSPGWTPSSGMLRRAALVRTDVSEDLSASIISVTIGEQGTLAVTSNWCTLRCIGC